MQTEITKYFTWKLEPKVMKKSIFTGKKINEHVDAKKVFGFIKNKMGEANTDPTWPFKHDVDHLKKYLEVYDDKLKVFKTSPALSKNKWGRVNPKGQLSLSVFRRSVRHSLAHEIYADIDMRNSSPSIFRNVATQNGVAVPCLSAYDDDSQAVRQQIMAHHGCSKDIAKTLPITLSYGGSYSTWLKRNGITVNVDNKMELFTGLESEMGMLRELVWVENQHIHKDVVKEEPAKWKTTEEAKRGLIAVWCYTIERHLQEMAITWVSEVHGYPLANIIPCQDGFMILKKQGDDDAFFSELCRQISDHVKTVTNCDIVFLPKPMDEHFEIEALEDVKSLTEWVDELSPRKLADRLIESFSHFIMVTAQSSGTGDVLSVFVYEHDRWHQEEAPKYYHLTKIISIDLFEMLRAEIRKEDTLMPKEKHELEKLLRESTCKGCKIKDIVLNLISTIPRSSTEFDNNPFLLGFNNGVYDLKNGAFRPYVYSDYVTMTTGYDYEAPDYENNEDDRRMREETDQIMKTIQPDDANRLFLMQILAAGLDGFGYQKLMLLNGEGGNGKGLVSGLMGAVLGAYFYKPSNTIITEIAANSASASPDICSLKNKRYVVFEEVNKINNAFAKQLTGGGLLRGRMLHSNPVQFRPMFITIIEFNGNLSISDTPGEAEERRCHNLDFPTVFTMDEEKIGQTINGVTYRRADQRLTTEAFQLKMRPIFLDMLLEIYKQHKNDETGIVFTIPQAIIDRTKKFLKSQDVFRQLVEQRFEVVPEGETSEPVKIKDIWAILTTLKAYNEMTKMEKRQFNYGNFVTWLGKNFKVEQQASKSTYLAYGLRALVDDDDQDGKA